MSQTSSPEDVQQPTQERGQTLLSEAVQRRNLLAFSANWSLVYLASPVTYVGVMQAALVNELKFSDTSANLPASIYLWTAPLAVLVLCRFPQTRMIKPLMIGAYVAGAVMGSLVSAALYLGDDVLLFNALIGYATVWGCCNGLIASCLWEVIGRGVAPSRRGRALALSFGVGPVFAVIASMVSQSVLGGESAGWGLSFVPQMAFPDNFILLYAASVVIMLLAAVLSSFFVIPQPVIEPPRPPWLSSVFGGFKDFVSSPLLLYATLGYVLIYSGHEVLQNLALYAKEVLGGKPSDYTGKQLTLRFGFKIFAGFALAWLLVRTSPRALLYATASLTLSAVLVTLVVPDLYLLSFGILGAGELFGVYYLNYIERCSRPTQIRRNIAFASMATMLVGFAPVLYGAISDHFTDKDLGYRLSFVTSIGFSLATLILVAVTLPAHPRPEPAAMDEEKA